MLFASVRFLTKETMANPIYDAGSNINVSDVITSAETRQYSSIGYSGGVATAGHHTEGKIRAVMEGSVSNFSSKGKSITGIV
jgi:CRISPR/Cas system CSM-associated protein Csm4 (group 5 of RAMP superfamily)